MMDKSAKRVAIGGLHTECSSYSPLEQIMTDFTRREGQELCEVVSLHFKEAGIKLLPIFHDRSVPGGPVSNETFQKQRSEFMARLKTALPLEGVLLLMHGAMFVRGIEDPEGEFIEEVREIIGPDAIISAAFDLHGQVTQKIFDHLDAFSAYRTAPHIDTPQTYARAAKMLTDALNGGARPMVRWVPVPILVPGEMSSTFVAPCDRLYAQLPKLDEQPNILDCNLMIGYVWADSPRATAAAVVTATDAVSGQTMATKIAKTYTDARDELVFDMQAETLDEALNMVDGKIAILADSGDNPTAGGVGDRADVLDAIIKRNFSHVLFAGISDPKAYDQLVTGAQNISIGGTLGGGGPRVNIAIDHIDIVDECAILKSINFTIIVTKFRRPFHNFSDFEKLGISLDDYPLLVVKSGYLSPDLRTLPRVKIMALTDGAVCQNLSRLENLHRPKETWPFNTH